MSHVSDTRRQGAAYYAGAAQSDGGELGVALPVLLVKEFGAVATKLATCVAVAASVTTAGNISATGTLAAAGSGVATFDVARGVRMSSTGDMGTMTFVVTGTDMYGAAQTENFTGPTTTATISGVKAFKTVSSVSTATAGTATAGLTVGHTDVLGLPWHMANLGRFIACNVDGLPTAVPGLVVGLTATGTSTATTADVRGTMLPTIAPDGAKYFTAVMMAVPTTKELLYGPTPA